MPIDQKKRDASAWTHPSFSLGYPTKVCGLLHGLSDLRLLDEGVSLYILGEGAVGIDNDQVALLILLHTDEGGSCGLLIDLAHQDDDAVLIDGEGTIVMELLLTIADESLVVGVATLGGNYKYGTKTGGVCCRQLALVGAYIGSSYGGTYSGDRVLTGYLSERVSLGLCQSCILLALLTIASSQTESECQCD